MFTSSFGAFYGCRAFVCGFLSRDMLSAHAHSFPDDRVTFEPYLPRASLRSPMLHGRLKTEHNPRTHARIVLGGVEDLGLQVVCLNAPSHSADQADVDPRLRDQTRKHCPPAQHW